MKIRLSNIGKRFSSQWIFKNVNWDIAVKRKYAILGTNGSGKSTLLQIIAGYVTPSVGIIEWDNLATKIERERLYKHVSICTPASHLQSEWTVAENIAFHLRFKESPLLQQEILKIAMLEQHAHKKFRNLSSGMQQRLKLSLACISHCDLLLLDEPCSHLDTQGILWYKNLLEKFAAEKTVIIASNSNTDETFLCEENYRIEGHHTNDGGASW